MTPAANLERMIYAYDFAISNGASDREAMHSALSAIQVTDAMKRAGTEAMWNAHKHGYGTHTTTAAMCFQAMIKAMVAEGK